MTTSSSRWAARQPDLSLVRGAPGELDPAGGAALFAPDNTGMVHLQTMWHEFNAEQGNAPGAQQGDVVVTLLQSVGDISEVIVPSGDVSIAAEAGSILGVQVKLPDGRRLFVMGNNVAGIIDAPPQKARDAADDDAPSKPASRARQAAR